MDTSNTQQADQPTQVEHQMKEVERYFNDPIVNYFKKITLDLIVRQPTIYMSERDQNKLTHINELLKTYLKENYPSITSPDKGDSL